MMNQQAQVKRKNKPKKSQNVSQISSTTTTNAGYKGTSSTKKKRSSQNSSSSKKKELLPQANGGIQRINQRPVYKKRDFPKTHFNRHTLLEICPLCEKEIGKDHSAIQFGNTQEPAHFACVLSWLQAKYPTENNQQIAYIGSGKFAIIATPQNQSKQHKIEIIRHLDFAEDLSLAQPTWKRQLAITPELLVSLDASAINRE